MDQNPIEENKTSFLLKNLAKGIGILILLLIAFLLFKKYGGSDYFTWLEPIYSRPVLVYTTYAIAEVFFGLLPPELFMAWGLEQGDNTTYILIVSFLALISYGAGWFNFILGRNFRKLVIVRFLITKYLKKYIVYLDKYGGFLLIVAAVTPLPYTAICLLVGTLKYSPKKFFLYTLSRIARFAVYATLVWSADQI